MGASANSGDQGCRDRRPFRGTNARERIAIAKAVLAEIGAHAQALATTHDVELQRLLGEKFVSSRVRVMIFP